MNADIDVQVQLFARMRELCGNRPRVSLRIPDGGTPATCFELLCAQHAGVRTQRESLAVAVNQEYAAWDEALADGDEVSFIPPVSGG